MSGVSAPSLLLSRTLNRDLLSSRSLVGLPLASPHLQQYRFSTHKYITQVFHLHPFTFNNTDSVHTIIKQVFHLHSPTFNNTDSVHTIITQVFLLHLSTFNNTDSVHTNISHRSQSTQIYHTGLPL